MPVTRSKDDLAGFVSSLSSTQLDRFVRVMSSLQNQGSAVHLQRLEKQYETVTKKLDAMQDRRDTLKARKDDLRGVLQDLDASLADHPASTELLQMRLLIQQLESEIDTEIAETRPNDLLAEKARLKDEIGNLRLMSKLAALMLEQARRRDGR